MRIRCRYKEGEPIKKYKRVLLALLAVTVLAVAFAAPAFALTEEEVQAQVDSAGREQVTGNVLIWFLCAIGFLKVSQKIDSFMSSLGINIGKTGGSMMAEAMIAARGIGMAVRGAGAINSHFEGGHGGRAAPAGGGGGSGGNGGGNFLRQSLGASIGHSMRTSAAKYATGQKQGGIGGAVFQRSLNKGGNFSNQVVSQIAQGDIRTGGVLKGDNASKAFSQYMGYSERENPPTFQGIEIGGGRISGTELNEENPQGIGFGMYNASQYMEPKGDFETVKASDGSKWYKQYAQDTVEKKPFRDGEGKVSYQENIVKRVPDPPKRKDRV